MALPVTTPEKLKIPGENQQAPSSTTNPSFASPNVQTAADVRQSQAVAGNAPAPKASAAAQSSPVTPFGPTGQPTPENPQQTKQQNSPAVIPNATPTSAPAPAAPKTPTPTASAVTASPGLAQQAQTATVPTTTGAPPGVPLTTPTVGLAPTMKSTQGKNAAESEYLVAQNENAQKLYEAALAYNGGPTGALETDKRAAELQNQNATAARGAAGTIESSLYGEDKTRIATNEDVANTKAEIVYQEAVNTANQALAKAQAAFQKATEQEKREIAEAAERKEATEALEKANAPAPVAAAPVPAPPTVVSSHPQPITGSPKPKAPTKGKKK